MLLVLVMGSEFRKSTHVNTLITCYHILRAYQLLPKSNQRQVCFRLFPPAVTKVRMCKHRHSFSNESLGQATFLLLVFFTLVISCLFFVVFNIPFIPLRDKGLCRRRVYGRDHNVSMLGISFSFHTANDCSCNFCTIDQDSNLIVCQHSCLLLI